MRLRSGISLLEVVICALIMAVAFIPVLRLVSVGSTYTVNIGNNARAARLTQQLIEECKHVPFQVYQQTYAGLENGGKFIISEHFYQDTNKSIEQFWQDNKDAFRQYGLDANLRAIVNDFQQIVEIWFEVEIFWEDIAGGDGDGPGRRIVKAGGAYYNPEAL